MNPVSKNFIAGQWVAGGATSRNLNPSDISDVVGEYAQGNEAQALEAIAAAKSAFPSWSHSTPQQRYDVLSRVSAEILSRKDELGRLLSREEGKTLPEGIGEVTRAGQIFAFFAGEALRISGQHGSSVRPGVEVDLAREPIGVVGIICPWNFPIAIPARKSRRRSATVIASSSSPPILSRAAASHWPKSLQGAGFQTASLTLSWDAVRSSGRRC